jgi:hypothetical protein
MKTAKKTERNGEVSKAEALEFYRQLRTHNLPYFEAPKLLKRIWKCSRRPQVMEESGRVGEALGCPAPLEKRGFKTLETRRKAGAPAEAGKST